MSGLSLDLASHMIENAVATFELPLGVASGFVINGRAVSVPMVVGDLASVPACSVVAQMARAGGGFTAGSSTPVMIGQIQILDAPDMALACRRIEAAAAEWLVWLNTQNAATMSTHARAVGLETRELVMSDLVTRDPNLQSLIFNLPTASTRMLILHIYYDCGDAMGANLVNTACEALVPRVEMITGGRVNLRILSNLSDRRMAWARCVAPTVQLREAFAGHNPKPEIQNELAAASQLAQVDPYCAATLNASVMSGVDAVVIATGNDWRAVEAGAHAYAARDGHYRSLARWYLNEQGDLAGKVEMPLAVGIVGGATRVHPTAQAALQIMGVRSARELAEIAACAGLAQSLAALISSLQSKISLE